MLLRNIVKLLRINGLVTLGKLGYSNYHEMNKIIGIMEEKFLEFSF